MPIQSRDGELLNAMSIVHIQNLIEEKLAEKIKTKDSTEILKITDKGKSQLKREFIDYQLDLLTLEQSLGNYFSGKINNFRPSVCYRTKSVGHFLKRMAFSSSHVKSTCNILE